MKQKVFVGMSGGVDSAVSAYLLKKKGYAVTGVFIQGWYPEAFPCTWREDRLDAMRVAAHLGIPFVTVDLSKEYKQYVIDYLLKEYAAGRTPNPDVLCNRDVKFGAFLAWALENGADMIATGHYARTAERGSDVALLRGVDSAKDQSYFLYMLQQEALSRALFPVGGYTKKQIRSIATHARLPVAQKPDSQGLCFLGQIDMQEFLGIYLETKPGVIYDSNGLVIGEHSGAIQYTYGQRHGFSITSAKENEPLYVLAKNIPENTITVGPKNMLERTGSDQCLLTEITWTRGTQTLLGATAQYRYHGAHIPISDAEEKGADLRIHFVYAPNERLAEGQSVVLYRGEECMGGGIVSTGIPAL